MSLFRFERLIGWQKAIDYADAIYTATDLFPREEKFGLTSQLRRSAVSVSSNIAEGTGRSTDREQSRFVEIGYGSLMENVSQLHVGKRRNFVTEESFRTLYQSADELARILSGLRSHLNRG